MNIDQSTARTLFQEGGFFLFLGVPEGTEFGIDLKSWNTGEKFRGVKMIPPGLHFIFYNSVSNTGDVAPRCGFFHYFKKSEFLVKKWDNVIEGLSSEEVPQNETVALKDNVKALDQFLGPYPFSIWEKWKSLSSNLTEQLAGKLISDCGEVRSALELESCSDADRPRGIKGQDLNTSSSSSSSKKSTRNSSSASEEDFLPQLKAKSGTELKLTVFPIEKYPAGATPSEITQHSLDSSYLFEQYVNCYVEPTDILGELEFSYICFLVGHSLEAFEQWKKIFSIFCSCENAVKKYRKLYNLFLLVIEIQVQETPEEFLADIVANNNVVYVKLRDLFKFIRSSDVGVQLKNKAERLRTTLTGLYQWDFSHLESENEDEAPVIVNLND